MSEIDHPGFRRLATDGDDSRWLADQAALRRQAAARQARGWRTGASDTRAPDALVQARFSPALIGGGLMAAAAAITIVALWLYIEPGLLTRSAGVKPARSEPAGAPVAASSTLPCYVGGVSLGVLPLVDCAEREGREMDRLDAERTLRSTRAVLSAGKPGHAVEERATALKLSTPAYAGEERAPVFKLSTPPRARPVQTVASPMQRFASSTLMTSPPPRLDAPPRPAPSPSVGKSTPLGERLDDATLAAVDARREASREAADAPS